MKITKKAKCAFIVIFAMFNLILSKKIIPMPVAPTTKTPTTTIPTTPPPPVPTAIPPTMPTTISRAKLPAAMPTPQKPALPVPAPKPAVSLQQQAIQTYKKELDQISTNLQMINTLKDELKAKLSEFDEKLNEARRKANEAKTTRSEILRLDTLSKAHELFNTIQQNLRDIQTTQTFVQISFAPKFNENTSKINVLIAQIDGIIKNLQAKQAPLHLTPPKMPTTVLPKQTPEAQKQAQKVKPPTPNEKKSIIKRTTDYLSKGTAYFVNRVRKAFDWLRKPSTTEIEKKKTNNTQRVTKKTQQETTAFPEIPGVSQTPGAIIPGIPGTQPSITDQVKLTINTLNTIMKTFDEQSIAFGQQYQQVKKAIRELRARIQTMPLIAYYVEMQKKVYPKQIRFRLLIEHMFSKFLDLVALSAKASITLTKKTYDYLFAGIINRFTKDVQKKLKEMEAVEKKPKKVPESKKTPIQVTPTTSVKLPAKMPTPQPLPSMPGTPPAAQPPTPAPTPAPVIPTTLPGATMPTA